MKHAVQYLHNNNSILGLYYFGYFQKRLTYLQTGQVLDVLHSIVSHIFLMINVCLLESNHQYACLYVM